MRRVRIVSDRVGLGWRPELAIALHRHLDRVEVLEFLAEEWFAADRKRLDTLCAWSRLVPVHLHGTSLGLASAVPVATERLDRWARLVAAVRPAQWSEHLAFVRGGGVELGHLAAPPRTAATIAGAQANLALARRIVGSSPLVENVASLIEAPASDIDEPAWLTAIIAATDAGMLLDLHNLHANAVNGGWDAMAALDRLPVQRVRAVHLAGGRPWRGRILDDHRHAVPDPVFDLLTAVAQRVPGDLDVIIERDGGFPPIEELLEELDRARVAIAAGRASRQPVNAPACGASMPGSDGLADADVEAFLARLYTDAPLRAAFLADPAAVAGGAGLAPETVRRLVHLDRHGLVLAADSLAAKRAGR